MDARHMDSGKLHPICTAYYKYSSVIAENHFYIQNVLFYNSLLLKLRMMITQDNTVF